MEHQEFMNSGDLQRFRVQENAAKSPEVIVHGWIYREFYCRVVINYSRSRKKWLVAI
jgi:acyl dehydratase